MGKIEINPKELLEDIIYVNKFLDARLLVLYLHLYFEYFITKMAEISGIEGNENFDCPNCSGQLKRKKHLIKKAEELHKKNIISTNCLEIIKLVNELRSRHLIHKLRPDAKILDELINKCISCKNIKNPQLLKAWRESAPFTRLQISSLPIITKLYEKLKILNKEEITYKIKFSLGKNVIGDYQWKFELLEKDKRRCSKLEELEQKT